MCLNLIETRYDYINDSTSPNLKYHKKMFTSSAKLFDHFRVEKDAPGWYGKI
jgi:hypothetical protein